ncbi:MAG: sulfatase family protein [Rubrobacter sp.]
MSKVLLNGLVFAVVIVCFALVPATSTTQGPEPTRHAPPPQEKPNILFILTDDLDARSTSRMPKLENRLAERGTTFDQAFATTPQCCPARASFLTGKYAHNHTVLTNDEEEGGAFKFRSSGEDESTMATRLDKRGYETILIGKYLNYYDGTYIPPGWDRWHGQIGRNNDEHEYNVNGTIKYFDPDVFHDTDLFSDWAAKYIRRGAGKERPFFMYLSVNAPHGPAIPAERHKDEFPGIKVPRPPSFNERDMGDKVRWVRTGPRFSGKEVREMDSLYRDRLRSMLSVDDMIGRLVKELGKNGELDNTYIVFTSDHGFHMGQHRLEPGKGRPYEEDIEIPLYVRGPGVPEGRTLGHKVLNLDFAPTFAELGGAEPPASVDGRSFAPVLGDRLPSASSWRESFLVEFYHHDPFSMVRTGRYSYVEYEAGERELYDLKADPYQLRSLHGSPQHQKVMDDLHARLLALKNCSGQDSCEAAERTDETHTSQR